jgi:epoxyqueuosine reductase
MNPVYLPALFSLDEAEFRQRFRHTPLWRTKRCGLLRNAAIALGNQADPAVLPALCRGLSDVEPLVRAAAAWALGRGRGSTAREALTNRLAVETDAAVRREIEVALGSINGDL